MKYISKSVNCRKIIDKKKRLFVLGDDITPYKLFN